MDDRARQIANQALELQVDAYRMRQSSVFGFDIEKIRESVETPIEAYFLQAYAGLVLARGIECKHDLPYGESALQIEARCEVPAQQELLKLFREANAYNTCNIDMIFIQSPLGKFRADCVICRLNYGTHLWNGEWREAVFIAGPVVVECDGFEFHDRTKEQAVRDKRRDRAMVGAGYPVFRFAGSELFRDPFAAAGEVDQFLSKNKSFVGWLASKRQPADVEAVLQHG